MTCVSPRVAVAGPPSPPAPRAADTEPSPAAGEQVSSASDARDSGEGVSGEDRPSTATGQRRAVSETRSGLPVPIGGSLGRGATMPGKERSKKEDKKLLKGLQIFKRSKSKPSLHSSPSITAAVSVDEQPKSGESTPVFRPSSPTVTSAGPVWIL